MLPSRNFLLASSAVLVLAAGGCATGSSMNTETSATPAVSDNPLLAPWPGPHGGVPPFDRVRVEHFRPALEAAMAENLAEVDRIAGNAAAPTFANTIEELERAGRTLNRVSTVYGVWSSTMNSPEFQAVEREMAPRLAAFNDRIVQNEALFQRIGAVYESPDTMSLSPEQRRLAWLYHNNFVRAGARLNASDKARMSQINQELAGLFTQFSQNVLADETNEHIVIRNEAELAGLPQSVRDAAASAAAQRNLEGAWVITNTRSAMEPLLTYAENRDLRRRAFQLFAARGDMGGAHDNNELIPRILSLRAERAKLLGYETHAHWRLENAMARNPERAMELMEAVWPAAVGRVREEVADMQALARREGQNITIEPWDYRFYAEKVRRQRYDLDQDEVKQYLQLDSLVQGMFWVGGELFGFDFRAASVPVYHPDVRVWEVTDRSSGRHVGLFYFDPYARAGKRSGAWMNAYRRQQRLDGEVTTIVSNNSNFVKGRAGEPVLISWIDATTLFHEFGHALHGLASNVTYPALAGTAVARDYVEFPSQLLEHWLETPEVLERFAVHHRTGEPIPQELVQRIQRASTFNQGFATVEYLASGLIDMKLHLEGDRPIDPRAFERETLAELGMPREIIMRHRTPHFLHVFASDGYSAGYYSYLWSDVLTADAHGAFMEAGGMYDRTVADRMRQYIFSVGNTIDPAEGYRQFRGRDPEVEALMRKRGFLPAAETVGAGSRD
jgi:peptidyl-dipeptidase Dcp